MKAILVFSMCLSLSLVLVAQENRPGSAKIVESYGNLPLAFEANQGQSDPQVMFLSRGAGYSLFLTSTDAVLTLRQPARQEVGVAAAKTRTLPGKALRESKSAVLRMKLLGANAKTEVTGQDELPGKSNYFIGNDPKQWHTNVRQFEKVRYENVYPGVNLVYYGHQRELEYDFVLQPGADPQLIRLGIEGATKLRLERGDLVMTSAAGDVHLRSPHIYQEANGVRNDVRGGYMINARGEVGFEVAAYDRRRALVIDPVLAYATFLGGDGFDYGYGIAVDSAHNAYVTGWTASTDFPTANPIQTLNGLVNAFVSKINADGSGLVYSTYLGGAGGAIGSGIAVDSAGNAYVTGSTASPNFPTVNAVQPTNHGGEDAFVTKVNAAGSALVYSTYLGGKQSDVAHSIAVDSAGRAYVSGYTASTDFPTVNALQPTYGGGSQDAFVTKISAAGTRLVYSTYLGGSGDEGNLGVGSGIAVDTAGDAYVTGITNSTDFPTANALQPNNRGHNDAFVTKINAAGSALVYSTYLGGGNDDNGSSIAADTAGNAYVTGFTDSADFPTVNALQPNMVGLFFKAFVTKINAAGNAVVYSTYLGGSSLDGGLGIAADVAGNAYVTGFTNSTDFPVANAIQPTLQGTADVFVSEIRADGSAFVYSTYLGGKNADEARGIAVDSAGSAYITGDTYSMNFPKTAAAFQLSRMAQNDSFVAKIAAQTFVNVSPRTLGFARQVIGTTSVSKRISLTNNGISALTLNKIYFIGASASDFAETNTCSGSLAAGGTCNISVIFSPTAQDTRKAVMVISDSDPASPQTVGVIGTGTVVSLSGTKLSFGKQAVATTSAIQNITLTNVGSTQLIFGFGGISIVGMNPGDFSQTNTCGTSIAGLASCTITVTFKPTAIGTRTAAVNISDDGGGSPQRVILTGTGT